MNRLKIGMAMGALLVVMLGSSEALAQRGGFLRMMNFNVGQLHSELLAIKEIQEELKLTDEQKEKIVASATDIRDSWRTERMAIMREGGDAAEIKDLLKELQSEEKELVEALDDDQKKRLKQLMVQRMGNAAFQNDKVVSALSITDEQKKDIAKAFEESYEDMEEAMEEMRESGDFQGIRTAMMDIQADLTKTLMGFMSEEQKSKFEELKGKKFEFPQRQRGGRRNF